MTRRYTQRYALLFALTAVAGHYPSWLALPPTSIHQWRQADGAAIAGNYARNPDFWSPEVCNLFYAGDAHALGEFPLLYWLSGLVSRFGAGPAYPLRWIGLLLLFAGGWAFGWLLLYWTQRAAPAALGAALLLSSPILVYYGPGFLPDAPGFCLVLLLGACLLRAEQRQNKAWLCAAALCAALAILLKLSMAIVPLALAIGWAQGKWRKAWPAASLWAGAWPPLLFAGVAAAVLGFYAWAASYNTGHHTAYFLASTRPIWNYDGPFIIQTLKMMATTGLPVYASVGLYLAVLGSCWLSWRHWKSTPAILQTLLLCTALGSVAYFLLWFRMFREHDYYALCLLALPALLLLNGLRLAALHYGEKQLVYALGFCWLLGLGQVQVLMKKRLDLAWQPQSSENLPPDAFLPADALLSLGVPLSARLLCPQDPSPNIALLALQRQGWTAYNFGDRITADTLSKYQSKFGLRHLALRDTIVYGPLYRQFFPQQTGTLAGWYFYTAPKQ